MNVRWPRKRVDDVRLTAGIVVLEEDDVTRFEAVALDVAHGEVLMVRFL